VHFDDDLVAFLTGGVSITLASRNAALVPSTSRAKGCRVLREASRIRLRVFVSALQAGDFLGDIRSTGMISATFTVPRTHRTLQFKSRDARIDAVNTEDLAAIAAAATAFAANIEPLGFAHEFSTAFLASPGDEVAIEFTPTDAFQQTPGPAAGERL